METDAVIPMTPDQNYYDKVQVGEVVILGGKEFRVKTIFNYDAINQVLKVRLAPLREAIRL